MEEKPTLLNELVAADCTSLPRTLKGRHYADFQMK